MKECRIKLKRGKKKVFAVLDPEDYEKYKGVALSLTHGKYVQFRHKGQQKVLAREIMGLTFPWHRATFETSNYLDMRKKNLKVLTVPPHNRGKFCVHFPDRASN